MSPNDLRTLCTALGFLAVILKDVPEYKRAIRAESIGRLIESYCYVTVPETIDTRPSNENDPPGENDT